MRLLAAAASLLGVSSEATWPIPHVLLHNTPWKITAPDSCENGVEMDTPGVCVCVCICVDLVAYAVQTVQTPLMTCIREDA